MGNAGSKLKSASQKMNEDIRPSCFDRLLVGKKDLVGAEIGVYAGDHAQEMFKKLDIKKLYLIDPYELYPAYAGHRLGTRGWRSLPGVMMYAKKILKEKGYAERIVWLIMMANEAVNKVNEPLDFVYIDGNHDYGFVMDDITNWAPKVKEGGLVGGHDYGPSRYGVYEAVNDYCSKNNIEFQVEGGEWMFWKK